MLPALDIRANKLRLELDQGKSLAAIQHANSYEVQYKKKIKIQLSTSFER
jgi:hypothetical protein